MSPSSSVIPIAPSRFFKTQIFRNNNGGRRTRIWNPPTKNDSSLPTPLLPRRLTRVTPPVLPPLLRLPHPSPQIRHRSFLSHPPLLHYRESPMSSLADSNATNAKTVRVVVKGRVQGVFYRNWTVENAKELGLKGWVRNRRDGSVEALFSGSPDKVLEMEQRCRRGPPAAMVTGFEVSPCSDDPGTGFDRRPTV